MKTLQQTKDEWMEKVNAKPNKAQPDTARHSPIGRERTFSEQFALYNEDAPVNAHGPSKRQGPRKHSQTVWELYRTRKHAEKLAEALRSCERVFKGWVHDANPHNDLKQGDSADYDAANIMLQTVRATLADYERSARQ